MPAVELVDFTPVDLPDSLPSRAAIRSTMWPLAAKHMTAGNWVMAFWLIMRRWRARVKFLRELEVIPSKRYGVSMNCRPFGVKVEGPKTHFCRRISICPWCHMRRTYTVFTDVVTTARTVAPDTETGVSIWSLVRVYRLGYSKANQFEACVGRLLNETKLLVSANASANGDSYGALWSITVAPGYGSAKNRKNWEVRASVLMMTRGGAIPYLADQWKQEVTHDYNSSALVKLVATFLRYPTGLMVGNIERVAETLTRKSKMRNRFYGTTGAFRERQPDG